MRRSQMVTSIHVLLCLFFIFVTINGAIGADPAKKDLHRVAIVVHDYENKALDQKYKDQLVQIIANKLVRHDFDVINTHAFPKVDKEKIKEITFKDNKNLCRTYGSNAILVIAPEVRVNKVDDMHCKVQMTVMGWGYDIDGKDLGISFNKAWRVTRRSCEEALFSSIKELGYLAGREFTVASPPRTYKKEASIKPDQGNN